MSSRATDYFNQSSLEMVEIYTGEPDTGNGRSLVALVRCTKWLVGRRQGTNGNQRGGERQRMSTILEGAEQSGSGSGNSQEGPRTELD
ncbi:hypothetical protein CRE_08684 [Caenorhabditis remanei]|uniref:Uncharacterized protein n=1 Tax=Caenorhabditis remanei TaxID=31234 RepID=E3LJD0_CAERE|nr:hypothetical protein CRE_08684 [Caenorhabditis remanei]